MRPFFRTLLTAAALVFCASAAQALTELEREGVRHVRALYGETLVRLASGEPPVLADPAATNRFFAVTIKPPEQGFGFDPLVNGQDASLSNLSFAAVPSDGSDTLVFVTFDNFGAPQELLFLLRQRPAGGPLAIENIFADTWNLKELSK